jgi:hypothetical protein
VAWLHFSRGVDWLMEAHLRGVFVFWVLHAFSYGWEDLGWWLIKRWWDDRFLWRWVVWVVFGLRTRWAPNVGINSRSSLSQTLEMKVGMRGCEKQER